VPGEVDFKPLEAGEDVLDFVLMPVDFAASALLRLRVVGWINVLGLEEADDTLLALTLMQRNAEGKRVQV